MIIVTDLTKEDLLKGVETLVRGGAREITPGMFKEMREHIEEEYDENEPVHLSFEGVPGEMARHMLTTVVLQGVYCTIKRRKTAN